jgi:hypothetical protein
VPRISARRPYHHDHASGEKAGRLEPVLAIGAALVHDGLAIARENDCRVGEIKAALGERGIALGGIEGDLHD